MLNMIENLTRIFRSDPQPQRGKTEAATGKHPATDPAGIGGDRGDISTPKTLDALRAQAGALQNQLPGMIAESLLQPATDSVAAQNPANRILSGLVSPAMALLRQTAISGLPQDQLQAFQSDVEQLRLSLPKMLSGDLLSALNTKSARASALNGIVNDLASQLTGLSDLIRQKLA